MKVRFKKRRCTHAKRVRSAKMNVLTCVSCLIVAFVLVTIAGMNYASGFGVSEDEVQQLNESNITQDSYTSSDSSDVEVLKSSNTRDVSSLAQEIKAENEEKARKEAEAKKKHEEECIAQAEANKNSVGKGGDGVNFAIGKEAFVSLWGARIDSYLAGSPLSGTGKVFAEAAFEYGVDPRVSPAISNTESSKGRACYKPHNAWGWMTSANWSNWTEAIYAHIRGFAKGYGYTVTESVAKKYCPPNWSNWYRNTKAQMALI